MLGQTQHYYFIQQLQLKSCFFLLEINLEANVVPVGVL